MKKKTSAIFLVVALLAIAIAGGTLAFFTDTAAKTNTFTVGNVDITLTEPNWDSSGSVDAPEVYPGEPLKKDPTVQNTGKNPAFVRIKVEGLDSLASAGTIRLRTDYVDGKLGTDWVQHTDGFYYYTKPLLPGETTDALFDQIVIPTDLTNGDASAVYNVVVTAEAVQAQGARPSWTAVNAMTVADIATWFNIAMPVTP